MKILVKYFAQFKQAAGKSEDSVETQAKTGLELFQELSASHGFTVSQSVCKLAINDEFADWASELKEGDSVAFLSPMSGG